MTREKHIKSNRYLQFYSDDVCHHFISTTVDIWHSLNPGTNLYGAKMIPDNATFKIMHSYYSMTVVNT